MIIIVDYNGTDSILGNFLKEKNVNFKFSSIEGDLLKASKIILPDVINVQIALKKLQLSNLFSVLRIIKKPILGINNGFLLMCNQILKFNRYGLGLFEFSDTDFKRNLEGNKIEEGLLEISNTSKLLQMEFNNKKIFFNNNFQLAYNEITKTAINFEGRRFSLICENKNYFGIQIFLNHPNNLEIFNEVLSNFVKL